MIEPKIIILGIAWLAWAIAAKELGLINILAICGLISITGAFLK